MQGRWRSVPENENKAVFPSQVNKKGRRVKKKPPVPSKPEFPRSFETFNRPGEWEQQRMESKEPYCFNGSVGIRKYRVTFEEVDEPKDLLVARLRKLWSECDNHHHWWPLRAEAAALGIELQISDVGSNKKAAK